MNTYTTNVLVTVSTSPMIFEVGHLKHTPLSYIFMLVKQYFFSLKMYMSSMNDELSDNIKKKFMLPLTIELQEHKEKVFHNAPVSPTNRNFLVLTVRKFF